MVTVEPQETYRLAAVRRYAVLESPEDGTFDRITALTARLLQVPIAVVSIVDEDRIWFRSRHGVDAEDVPRTPGLCASAILGDGPYVLPDAGKDPVSATNPLVAGPPGVRFYAGVPLTVSGGYRLGTLCVLDTQPRTLSAEDLRTLEDLAALVVDELELRLAARVAVGFEADLRRQSDELSEALQAALMPPRLPRVAGLEMAARYHPAAEAQIGGDFYDVFPLSRRGWGVALGDVCGKGAAAAAVTSAARYALRAAAVDRSSPSEVLAVVNEAMRLGHEDDPDGTRFCTLVYARLRPYGREFTATVSSGGHPLPFLLRADGRVEAVGAPGTLVGALAEATFSDRTARLRAGDTLVFYTDGLTEAEVDGRMLGQEGLAAIVASCAGRSAAGVVAGVAEAVLRRPYQRDDAALLALQVPAA